MKIFNLINIGERAGSGIPAIYQAWTEQGWKEPIILKEILRSLAAEEIIVANGSNRNRTYSLKS